MNMDVELDGLFRYNTSYVYEDYEYKEDFESRGSKVVLIPFLYSVVLVVGLLGNGLLLAVLSQKRRTYSISDTFILLLSVTDILLLVTLPLWAAQAVLDCGWCFKVPLCKISGAVFNINFYCGIFLLVCISLDHYLSIAHSTRLFSHKKPKLARISFLLVCLVSLLLTIPDWYFLVFERHPEWKEKTLCIPNCYPPKWKLVSHLLHHILGFLLPAVALIVCCSCILLQLQRSSKHPQKQRATMVILALVVVFFLCWMPYNITLIVDTLRTRSKEQESQEIANSESSLKTALLVTSALACVHACLRPLIYFGLCRNFRKQTLAVLKCARVESEGSLWELGMDGETLPAQSHVREELNQMTTGVEQSTQC